MKLDLKRIATEYGFLFNVDGFWKGTDWVNLEGILSVFPNVEGMAISSLNAMTASIMDDVWSAIDGKRKSSQLGDVLWKLNRINLEYVNVPEAVVSQLVTENVSRFERCHWKLIKKYRAVLVERVRL